VQTPAASFSPLWQPAPQRLTLDDNAVHVWRANLDQSPSPVRCFLRTLAAEECLRAERFYFQRDRDRFIVAHGILRALLGRYLDTRPESLSFTYGLHGKPALTSRVDNTIRFNISHSRGTALYAISRGREIGIDLELVRDDLEVERIAAIFFSRNEISELFALPSELMRRAFFLCWTRKEAYIKAKGEGLSMPLDQFEVSLVPGEPATLITTQRDSSEALRWSLRELFPSADHAAALAVEGRDWRLACWQWQR
jgi:4'-phosphopantetheinyl transferase